MPRWSVVLCVLVLVACQGPEPRRRTTDPDLWDPRHEALLNAEDPPEPRKDPEYTRASKSGAAGATLSETQRENTVGVDELKKARERQLAARTKRERAESTREGRWLERERVVDARAFAVEALVLRAELIQRRTLGTLLEQALAHGAARGDPRLAVDYAERRAAALGEQASSRRERARRAQRDAELKRRLYDAGQGRAETTLRAAREGHALHLDALRSEEAALRAAEAARRLRSAYLGLGE